MESVFGQAWIMFMVECQQCWSQFQLPREVYATIRVKKEKTSGERWKLSSKFIFNRKVLIKIKETEDLMLPETSSPKGLKYQVFGFMFP